MFKIKFISAQDLNKKDLNKKYRKWKPHKQTIIKSQIEVDIGIKPLVEWLNSFPSVSTEYSCQGDWLKSGEPIQNVSGTYILFSCRNLSDLAQICLVIKKFDYYGKIKVSVENYEGCLRFRLQIDHRDYLKKLIEEIK